MRAVIVSHLYADPTNRAKLRALAGLGVTLLPRALVGQVWREGRIALHTLPPQDARVETIFVRRHDAYRSSALAAFLDMVRPSRRPGLEAAAE